MDNQHEKITGYRSLTKAEIAFMNRIKSMGRDLDAMCKGVTAWNQGSGVTDTEVENLDAFLALAKSADAHRFTAMARTHFQEGLMCLTRAVAKPTDFF